MKRLCDHCHLEYEEEALFSEEIEGQKRYFCCKGCQGVYHLLRSSGLENFYEKVGDRKLAPPKENFLESSRFDSEAFGRKYVKEEEGMRRISLILEGIHCAACVWLNEKVLYQREGVIEVSINYTNNKASILWDPKRIKLSEIIDIIRSIGYDAYPYDPRLQEERANSERREYYTRMVVGIFCTMNIMWIAVAQYAGYFSGMDATVRHILNFASFVLCTPALFYSGWIFYRGAYFGLKHGFVTMDLLVASGATLAYLYSIYAALSGIGETYFESVTMIITFVLIGKFLEVKGKKSAVDALDSLNSQIPEAVIVVRGEERISLAPEEVEIGEVVEILPGERLALDGVLLSSKALMDESALSGESLPIQKSMGETLLSGAINLQYAVQYRVSKSLNDSLLSSIIRLVEDSLGKKPQIEKRANELSRRFSTTILSLALLTFALWYGVIEAGFERSLVVAISVIVIACPCALALATPIASLVGLTESIKKKLLFKEARFLETMAKANLLLVDKTGTLTLGRPQVVREQQWGEMDRSLWLSLVQKSTHPVSVGVASYLKMQGIMGIREFLEFEQIDSKGLRGVLEEGEILGGSLEFLREHGVALGGYEPSERTLFAVAFQGALRGVLELEDPLKPHAKESLEGIRAQGIEVVMLTGDHFAIAAKVAQTLEISEFHAAMNPLEKADFVEKMRQRGRVVVMAGDGINDALALSKSDIAVAMGQGTDVAIAVSDVVVLDDSLLALQEAFSLSHRTYRFIKQNIALSLTYNALTIPLAAMGYVIPLVAAASMSFSSLLVVGNSLRIKKG